MKNNQTLSYKNLAQIAASSRSMLSVSFTAGLAATVVLGASAQVIQNQTDPVQNTLKPGDIVYADSGNAVDGGFVIKVDAATGQKTVISSGGYLQMPFQPVIDADGQVVVSDSGRLVRINPDTGTQQVIADNSRRTLGLPYGVALNSAGQILAANLQNVVEVDPLTSQIGTISAGGNFLCPLGVAVAANDELFVLNMAFPAQIVRVNPRNGLQKVISQGGFLNRPQAIAISGSDLYVTDVATPDGNFGVGRVIHIDAHTGAQTVVAQGQNLIGPVGIAIDQDGLVVVGDPYTVNPQSSDPANGGYDGGIIRIDPATGQQTVLSRGEGGFVNPRGVVVVPSPSVTH